MPMHKTICEKVEILLPELPRYFEQGEQPPPGWAILSEAWLCRDGRIVGVHPNPIRVKAGWLVSYETTEETTLEKLLDPDPWNCRTCRTSADPCTAGWVSDVSVSPAAHFCPSCVARWSSRRRTSVVV
ncbi:MAG TPA: hypothetical protein VLJ80_15090 [Solirubrobacteraceae bacterium]|nr:hypothetical protein [Solirubrobacteraceae bacterium]